MKLPIKLNNKNINVNLKQHDKYKIANVKSSVEDLELRLMVKYTSDDSKVTQLNVDVLNFVESGLASGQKANVLNFLNKNKHRFSPELKDQLVDVITGRVK